MNDFTPYFVVAWVVVMIGVFPTFSTPRRAVLFIILSGMLFLPEAISGYVKLGPLHFTKYQAISYAALFGALLYDSRQFSVVNIRWFDIPVLIWCFIPLASSLTNDPPPDGSSMLYDAISQILGQVTSWGIPYLLGRVYFCNRSAIRELAYGLVIGTAIYAPFCLYEIKMSPQLHTIVYGYTQHDFIQSLRFGGYRPMVFLPHGLAVGMFMVTGSLITAWLWFTERNMNPDNDYLSISKKLGKLSLLAVTTAFLVKSTGAIFLGAIGGATLWLTRVSKLRYWMLLLVFMPAFYVTIRATGAWSGQEMPDLANEYIDAERASSMQTRIDNENLLAKRAFDRLWFGWGGWGRNLTHDSRGNQTCIPDGLWIIVFGTTGIIGLITWECFLLLPVVRFAITFPVSDWSRSSVAPVTVFSIILILWTIDCLFNAMVITVYPLIAGAVAGIQVKEFYPEHRATDNKETNYVNRKSVLR